MQHKSQTQKWRAPSSPDLEVCLAPSLRPFPSAPAACGYAVGFGVVWGWWCRSQPGETLGRLVRSGSGVGFGRVPFLEAVLWFPISPPLFSLPSENPKSGLDWAAAAPCVSFPQWRRCLGSYGFGCGLLKVGALAGMLSRCPVVRFSVAALGGFPVAFRCSGLGSVWPAWCAVFAKEVMTCICSGLRDRLSLALGERLPCPTVRRRSSQGERVVALFGVGGGRCCFHLVQSSTLFMPSTQLKLSQQCSSCSLSMAPECCSHRLLLVVLLSMYL